MTDPLTPNYKNGVGRLAVDRFDFQEHMDGYARPSKHLTRHKSNQIDLSAAIDGYGWITVQDALEALAGLIAPPNIPDATSSVKGKLLLAGDISGTATAVTVVGLRGRPITNAIPATNEVLTWNGTAWSPTATTGFTAGGDLTGTSVSQQVVSIAGDGYDICTINCSDLFFKNSAFPILDQYSSASDNGHNFLINAQGTNGVNKNGGNVIISGGISTTSLGGGVTLRTNEDENMLQVVTIANTPDPQRRVLSLLNINNLTTTDMPASTGDMVIYVRDTATPPSGGTPSNGTILHSSGGKLYVTQGNNDQFAIGSLANPTVWMLDNIVRTYTYRTYVQTTSSAQAVAFDFALPDHTAASVETVVVGKKTGSTNTQQYRILMGYSRHGGAPIDVGTVVNEDVRVTGSWIANPTISVVGNNIRVNTGSFAGTAQWFTITTVTLSVA